jgi:propanol-preferring alcohol dehydrogenase
VKRLLPRLAPDSTAVVLGAGGLGSFAIQFLRALTSARVIAVDRSVKRVEVAREMGAHEAIEGIGINTTTELRELTGGEGADAVLDFVGINESITAGLGAVRPTGAFALIGASGGGFSGQWYGGLPRDGEVFTFQGSSISDAQDVMALAEAGLIRSEVDVFSLDQVAEAYEALDAGQLRGRAVVTPES